MLDGLFTDLPASCWARHWGQRPSKVTLAPWTAQHSCWDRESSSGWEKNSWNTSTTAPQWEQTRWGMGGGVAVEMFLPVDDPHAGRLAGLAEFLQVPVDGAQAEVGVFGLQLGEQPSPPVGVDRGALEGLQDRHALPAEIFPFFHPVPPFLGKSSKGESLLLRPV